MSTRVTLAHPGGPFDEVTAERIIRSGDTVATDGTGRAVVTYPDGSTALLEENSVLTIEFVQTTAGDYVVRMQQTLGRVWYAVTRAVTLGSRYEVRTAAMASVIRAGSDSSVTVTPTGETTVATISGNVDTSAAGVDVSVPAGSSTTVSGASNTPSANTLAPNMPAPTPTSTPTPAPISSPSPTNGFTSPAATLPPPPVSSATPKPKPSPTTLPIPTPVAAPTPVPTPLKDRFGPRKDAPGQPPPKTSVPH